MRFRFFAYHVLVICFICAIPDCAKAESAPPKFLGSTILKNYYDGKDDDLLSAGWSIEQLAARKLPEQKQKSKQKVDSTWLRKAAYYNNIIALIDTTSAGGYSRLYGPLNSQPIPGFEYLSYSKDQDGRLAATLLVQIPDNFDHARPCIIVAASSGSRGIYGAVGTVGSWALTKQCAVAYTDKGTGTGFYFFDVTGDQDGGYAIDGTYQKNSQSPLIFSDKKDKKTEIFLTTNPTAISTKHAYSMRNVEKDSGLFVVQAAEFALYQINRHFNNLGEAKTTPLNKENTLIIAASISNGGAASLNAGELDNNGLFDGIVVAEPNIYLRNNKNLSISENKIQFTNKKDSSFDYFIAKNLYGPCALLSEKAKQAPLANHPAIVSAQLEQWCSNLKKDGFLTTNNQQELAQEAWKKITDISGDRKSTLDPMMHVIDLWPALAATYSNQFGRYRMADNLCSVYFSATDKLGNPISLVQFEREKLFATSNGIPPTAGIKLVSSNNSSRYQQAKCFYQASSNQQIEKGVSEVMASADLNKIPTIIIHGQDDNLINPNLSSRRYYANAKSNSANPTIRYYEVTNAQHFDAFAALPMYATEFIPLHYYFEKSLDLMMEHLINGKPLPPSQVVKTKTRTLNDNKIESLSDKHLTKIQAKTKNLIALEQHKNDGLKLVIPD